FQSNVTVVNGVIHVPAGDLVQLDAVLKPPPAPAPGPGPGADARAVTASLPASITIQFNQTGRKITKLPKLSVTVHGKQLRLARNNGALRFDSSLRHILVPADVTQTSFAIATDLSTLLTLSGSAPISSGAWALPVLTVLPSPVTVLGAGSVQITTGAG